MVGTMNGSSIKVVEGRKGGTLLPSYGVAISVTINDAHPVEQEIRHVNEAMINWLRERRQSAYGIKLFFVARKADQDSVVEWVQRLLTQDVDVRQYLLKLKEMDMFLLDPETREERQFNMTLS
jgi:hypothetical protein